MKKILFPTDFSEAANNAYVYALRLAEATSAQLISVHAYELPSIRSGGLSNTIADYLDIMRLEEFENYRDQVPVLTKIAKQQGLDKIVNQHVLEEGRAQSVIQRLMKKEEVDMIVMGTTGASGFKEAFMGSVASEVMENANCPVLAVPQEAKFDGSFDHFAMATNYSEHDKKALNYLMAWTKRFDAEIEVVHVDLNHTETYYGKMDAFMQDYSALDKVSFTILDATNFESAMITHLEASETDVLTMVSRKRGFWAELFHRSHTKQLSYKMKLPLLSLPASLLDAID